MRPPKLVFLFLFIFFLASFSVFTPKAFASVMAAQSSSISSISLNYTGEIQDLGTGFSVEPQGLLFHANLAGSHSYILAVSFESTWAGGVLNGRDISTYKQWRIDNPPAGDNYFYFSATDVVWQPTYTPNPANHLVIEFAISHYNEGDIIYGSSSSDAYTHTGNNGCAIFEGYNWCSGLAHLFFEVDDIGVPPATCSDGVQNQDETGVDIGGVCGGIPPPCFVDCFSNVLFLPGLEASRLYKQKTILGLTTEDQLWEPNLPSDIEDLYSNSDGTPINSNIYTRDIIKETNTPIPTGPAGQNIYKSFAETMDGLVANQKINAWKDYAYDWRQSVDDIVNNGTNYQNNTVSLVDTLQSLVDSSKNGKVTIVAHSNGGLLAKALLKKLQDDKTAGINNLIDSVDVLILVGVPEIGTAKAVPAILHGYGQQMGLGFLVDESHARELGRNMISAYGLLPSKEYINRVSASPVTFVDNFIPSNATTKLVQTFGSAINSYDEYKDFLFGAEGRTDPAISQTNLPISLSQNLFSQAESLHDGIDAWTPPDSLRVIEVAGWGLDTIASFEYYPLPCTVSLGCGFTLDERPRFTSDGDKTVIVPSAQYMGFLGNAEKYWINLFNYNVDHPFFRPIDGWNHGNILEVDSILDFISDTIKDTTPNSSVYISTTTPTDTSNRLRISIHSPVTLDAYDYETPPNHTGKICPPNSDFCYAEENIPNSSYLEFGEGKYLNLPEDKAKSIKLQGTDIGTFTYESEKVLPNGTSTVSSFVDIPVTTQTQAEVTLNPSTGEPQLALDVTGDGVTDFTLAPSATFDPITYLQIMKATIDSLDIPQAKIKAFNNRVDTIIKSIQNGKIDKAKLKAEKFTNIFKKTLSKQDPKKPKPKKLSKTDAQLLLDMLNKLLDNLS